MRKAFKGIAFFLSVLTVLLAAAPVLYNVSSAEDYTNYEINGVSFNASSVESSPNECWAYANGIYRLIWGQYFTSDFSSSDNLLRDLRDEELTLTVEHLKEYISAAPLGSVLRICNEPNLHANDGFINGARPGHNQILVQKDDEGFTVVQGGLTAAPHYREDHYTWEEFVSCWWLGGTYSYIKYIKWPSAPSYALLRIENQSAPTVYDAVYPSGTLMYGKKFSLSGVIYSPHRMTEILATVDDTVGNTYFYFSKRFSSNSFSIANEGVDASMPFAALTPGGYVYNVTVTDITGAQYTVISSFFTVAASKVANEEIIYNFLINHGFNLAAACGVLANIEHESYFNPHSLYLEKGGYYSHGLIQWNLGRYERLNEFFAANGYSWDDENKKLIEGQLLFMMHELTTDKYYKKTWDAVVNAENTSDGARNVAYNWCYYYEMPSDTEARSNERGELARTYFTRYTANSGEWHVSFDAQGGENPGQITVRYASPYPALPEITSPGRTFLGWYTMPEGGARVCEGDTAWISGDQLLHAHWENNVYSLHLVLGGDDNSVAESSYVFGTPLSLPLTYEREGYRFDGWYEDPSFEGEEVRVIEAGQYGDKTYYAKWRLYTGLMPEEDGIGYLKEGERETGFIRVGGNLVYFDRETGFMATGESVTVDGVEYPLEAVNYKGITVYRVKEEKNGFFAEENGVRYYAADVTQTGWQTPYEGVRMYFEEETGFMASELTLGNKTYTFARFTSQDPELWDLKLYKEVKNGFYEEDGGLRFYTDDEMHVGWLGLDGESAYFDPESGLMITDGLEVNGVYHPFTAREYEGFTVYVDDYRKEGFFEENGAIRYYVDGSVYYGWLEYDGNLMFFDWESGNMLRAGWNFDAGYGDVEAFEYEGLTLYRILKQGLWKEDGGLRYYENGVQKTGLIVIDGNTFLFDGETGLMVAESCSIDGVVYTLGEHPETSSSAYRVESIGLDVSAESIGIGQVSFLLDFLAKNYPVVLSGPDITGDGMVSVEDISVLLDILASFTGESA